MSAPALQNNEGGRGSLPVTAQYDDCPPILIRACGMPWAQLEAEP